MQQFEVLELLHNMLTNFISQRLPANQNPLGGPVFSDLPNYSVAEVDPEKANGLRRTQILQ